MGLRTDPWHCTSPSSTRHRGKLRRAARRHGRIAVQDYVLTLQFMKYVEGGIGCAYQSLGTAKRSSPRRGDEIYDREIGPHIGPDDEGKFVVIDIETGAYEIDHDELATSDRLLSRVLDAQMWTMRVGSRYARRVGSRAMLADGSDSVFDIYEAAVTWDGTSRRIAVDEVECDPLVGMSLLYGFELTVQVADGGQVVIRPLQ